jgi:adenylate cyclase
MAGVVIVSYPGRVREAVSLDVFLRMTGSSRERVEALRDCGLLDPDRDELFDDMDVLRLNDLMPYLERGYAIDQLAADIRDGTLEVLLGDLLFDRGETYSVEAAAEELDFDLGQLRALLAALGLSDARLGKVDLELIGGMKLALSSGLPFEGILETARVLGDSLRRIADAEVRLVHVHVHERLIASGVPEREINDQIFTMQGSLAPLLNPTLVRLHDVHMLNAAIEDALLHIEEPATPGAAPGSVEVTIVFVDLASFTMLTETQGDQAAVQVLARVEDLMRPLVLRYFGRVVKQIGDGFMLAFRDASDAVNATVALRDALAEPDIPAMRAGINTGIAIFRSSDYIGSTVNVASRVSNAAMAGQILLTATTAERLDDGGIAVEEVGVRLLRGVDEPLALYRPVAADTRRDPVCGIAVVANSGVRFQDDAAHEWAFCSHTCLQEFLSSPDRYRTTR